MSEIKEWYRCGAEEVLKDLGSGPEGLDGGDARKRLEQYGRNRLKEAKRTPAWRIFLSQFQDLLVMILIGAAVISMLTDNMESTVVIFAVILLNAALGTIQHEKAENSLESLRALSAPSARVMRDGRRMVIPSLEVVPGDILYLEAGDLAVADGRILESAALMVNESSLTGESGAVEKSETPLRKKAPLAERGCMIYSGSLITAGVARIVVTATGMNTEIGRIASLMDGAEEKKTPLQISLDQFSSRLAAAIMIICLIVFFLSIYRKMTVLDSLLFAVALAVAAIPEALGSIVTIVQAMGTQKMAKEQAIIKDLKAVESLGCVSVICTDKTGTLTQNKMKVEQVVLGDRLMPAGSLRPSDPADRFFLEACVLANDAELTGEAGGVGDATELALLELVSACGVSPEQIRRRFPRLKEYPFDSDRKMMSAVHRSGGDRILFCKGAADELLGHCRQIADRGKTRSLSVSDRKRLMEHALACSGQGLRVIGIAYRSLQEGPVPSSPAAAEDRLIFLGMAAMMDPPRPESFRAVADAKRAGIVPVMITGDHKATAVTVAKTIGILDGGEAGTAAGAEPLSEGTAVGRKPLFTDFTVGRGLPPEGDVAGPKLLAAGTAAGEGWLPERAAVGRGLLPKETAIRPVSPASLPPAVTGAELDAMSDQQLDRRLEQIRVYARVSPEHKLRIVKAWQRRGRIVAMTGDGVNDAPALKQADIGVAMGKNGTEVSKDAADMILADDNFATIIKAVANGRSVYRNIRNAIGFLLSGNMAGILCVLCTTLLALPLPFAPVHLLFINLLTDSLPAVAIGMEQPERRLLDLPPRDPKKGILTPGFLRDILLQGGLIAACTLCAYAAGLTGSLPRGSVTEWIFGETGLWRFIMQPGLITEARAGTASTMAFATLTLARLFHGFNCRGASSLPRLGLFSNLYTVLAFAAGSVLLAAVLFVPGLQTMFAAADLSRGQTVCVLVFAFLPTAAIQIWRIGREILRG